MFSNILVCVLIFMSTPALAYQSFFWWSYFADPSLNQHSLDQCVTQCAHSSGPPHSNELFKNGSKGFPATPLSSRDNYLAAHAIPSSEERAILGGKRTSTSPLTFQWVVGPHSGSTIYPLGTLYTNFDEGEPDNRNSGTEEYLIMWGHAAPSNYGNFSAWNDETAYNIKTTGCLCQGIFEETASWSMTPSRSLTPSTLTLSSMSHSSSSSSSSVSYSHSVQTNLSTHTPSATSTHSFALSKSTNTHSSEPYSTLTRTPSRLKSETKVYYPRKSFVLPNLTLSDELPSDIEPSDDILLVQGGSVEIAATVIAPLLATSSIFISGTSDAAFSVQAQVLVSQALCMKSGSDRPSSANVAFTLFSFFASSFSDEGVVIGNAILSITVLILHALIVYVLIVYYQRQRDSGQLPSAGSGSGDERSEDEGGELQPVPAAAASTGMSGMDFMEEPYDKAASLCHFPAFSIQIGEYLSTGTLFSLVVYCSNHRDFLSDSTMLLVLFCGSVTLSMLLLGVSCGVVWGVVLRLMGGQVHRVDLFCTPVGDVAKHEDISGPNATSWSKFFAPCLPSRWWNLGHTAKQFGVLFLAARNQSYAAMLHPLELSFHYLTVFLCVYSYVASEEYILWRHVHCTDYSTFLISHCSGMVEALRISSDELCLYPVTACINH